VSQGYSGGVVRTTQVLKPTAPEEEVNQRMQFTAMVDITKVQCFFDHNG
jgi:hypothetical protein